MKICMSVDFPIQALLKMLPKTFPNERIISLDSLLYLQLINTLRTLFNPKFDSLDEKN